MGHRRPRHNSYASLKFGCQDAGHGRLVAREAPGQLQRPANYKEVTAIPSRLKSKLAIGTVALAAVAFAGGAYAATQQPTTNARQAFLADVAKRLNVTPAQLSSALKAAALDRLAAAVKVGKLTQAQADALKQDIQNRGGAPFFFGFGAHKLGERRFFGGPSGAHGPLAVAAKYLGLTGAQLRKQLVSGKSLAQIAKAQGKSTSGLEQALTGALQQRLDKAVAKKRITAAQELKLLSRLSSRVGDLINRTLPKDPGVPGMGHGAFGYRFHGGSGQKGRFMPPGGGPAALPGAPAPGGPVA
jgi:hypothetical protein